MQWQWCQQWQWQWCQHYHCWHYWRCHAPSPPIRPPYVLADENDDWEHMWDFEDEATYYSSQAIYRRLHGGAQRQHGRTRNGKRLRFLFRFEIPRAHARQNRRRCAEPRLAVGAKHRDVQRACDIMRVRSAEVCARAWQARCTTPPAWGTSRR